MAAETTAYVDESMRSLSRLYVLAAGFVVQSGEEDTVAALRRVLPGRAARFHWRHESEATRMRMVDAVRELGMHALAFCYQADHRRWAERGRVLAMRGLLWQLRVEGIRDLVLETRGRGNDEHDRRTIAQAERAGHASRGLRYRFSTPYADPLLWIPDLLAGVIAHARAEGNDRYLLRLAEAAPTICMVEA